MPTVRTNKQLAQRQLVSTSPTLIYGVPSQQTETYVKMIVVTNTTGSSTTFSIWINQGGTATGDNFAFCKNRSIAANATDTFIFPSDSALILNGDNLFPNASIIGGAGAINSLTFHIHGYEVVQS